MLQDQPFKREKVGLAKNTTRGRSCLGDDLGGVGPAKRSGTGNRESHAPEVRIRSGKFDAYGSLSVALTPDRNNVALDRTFAVLVVELKELSRHDKLIHAEEAPVAVDGERGGLHRELLAIV